MGYLDMAGDLQTFSADSYETGKHQWPAFIALKSGETWPTLLSNQRDVITVTYTVGYGDSASDVPEAIKAAMLLIIGDLYENRTDTVKRLPTASEHLLNQYWKGF